jgi:alginate O-acetyltransferase complex protein AlgI
VLERAGASRALERWPRASHVYALLVVMIGWVLFRCDTLAHAMSFYAALAGFASGDALRTPVAEYLDPLVAIALGCGVVGAMPIAAILRESVPRVGRSRGVAVASISIELVWICLLATASAAWLAAGTYNPFIYFRF